MDVLETTPDIPTRSLAAPYHARTRHALPNMKMHAPNELDGDGVPEGDAVNDADAVDVNDGVCESDVDTVDVTVGRAVRDDVADADDVCDGVELAEGKNGDSATER